MDNEIDSTRRMLVLKGPVILGYDKEGVPTLSGTVRDWEEKEEKLLDEWFEHVKDERSILHVPGFVYARGMNGLDECPGEVLCGRCGNCGALPDDHTLSGELADDPDWCEGYVKCTSCEICGKEHE